RRDRLLRDDPAVVRQVRTRIRLPAAPPPTPTRRQVASRRGVLDDQRPSAVSVAGRRPGRQRLDILVSCRRDAKAAKRFFRKLLKRRCASPRVLVTDKLRSYAVAHRE
ncbi:MAG TPA: DDE-type integrase/transposase/recombinase, partial [Mycobacterium sp.]|nr:DDE-type integrase/transposase/recombinase [Mycobacterium sp.]